MASIADIVDVMFETGCTADQIKAVVRKMEGEREQGIAEKREKARLRKQKQRERESQNNNDMSHDVTLCHGDECDKKEKKEKRKEPKEKIKKIKNIYTPLNPPDRFDEFWELFPRKRRGSREKAKQAYCKAINEQRATEENIINGVRAYQHSDEATKNGGQFAKGCAAWLNDDRWTCDYSAGGGSNNQRTSSPADNLLTGFLGEDYEALRESGGHVHRGLSEGSDSGAERHSQNLLAEN